MPRMGLGKGLGHGVDRPHRHALAHQRFAHRRTRQPGQRGLDRIAQGLAVLPGLSRSGSTIALALFLGVRPARAFALFDKILEGRNWAAFGFIAAEAEIAARAKQ